MRDTLDFLLYDWLQTETLSQRERFADHSRETFDAVLDTCERIAREQFAPVNRLLDTQEPHFDGERVHLPEATREALDAYVASGMLSAAQDYAHGGMQLPCTVEMAANAFFSKACIALGGYAMLTNGNANLLMAHGTERQREVFAANEFAGRWFGTMCLSEPQAGSSLSDVATRAEPDGADFEADALGPRYRLRGNKMWISGGEHELRENIIHLVLAKIPGPDGKLPPGVRGISLFIVPKWMVGADGQLTGERNDVVLAGLNHKLGYRGTTNCLLNFGEGRHRPQGQGGAIGYRVGAPGEGLKAMFHMMNEARIGVGLGATMLGYAGYEASLAYARQRPQGRPMTAAGKDAAAPQRPIVEHADVRRMLLAQKSYVEGALALELFCARLVDEQHTAGAEAAGRARLLLEVLIPIAKSWPSEWCLEANSLAIQVLGGYGYTRLPGGAVLARQPPEHDPRGHARHPGAGPAGPQGGDGRRRGADGAGAAHQRDDHGGRPGARSCRGGEPARAGAGAGRCRHQGRLGHGRARGRAGQCHALSAGLRPHRAGVDLAGRGAGARGRRRQRLRAGQACRAALLLRLRAAPHQRLAGRGAAARSAVPRDARRLVLTPPHSRLQGDMP